MNIGERIKYLRKDLHLTQQEFAVRIGTSRNNIAGYEAGTREPSEAALLLICQKTGASEDWLRTGQGDIYSNLSVEEYLASWMGTVLAARDDDKRKRLVSALSRLSETGTEALYTLYEEGMKILREDAERKQNRDD